MVEAPGTAPGSVLLIPQRVYRHSRCDRHYYEYKHFRAECKGDEDVNCNFGVIFQKNLILTQNWAGDR